MTEDFFTYDNEGNVTGIEKRAVERIEELRKKAEAYDELKRDFYRMCIGPISEVYSYIKSLEEKIRMYEAKYGNKKDECKKTNN